MSPIKITAEHIKAMKSRGEKIAALTAYDYPLAKMLDEAGIPFLLVGDSLGMVVLGYPDTTLVTMADMEHHVRAVARARPQALLVADLPFGSYDTVADAVANARRLVAAGAEALKAEGGYHIKGRTQTERDALLADAQALAAAGAFALVVEIVTPPVAKELTALLDIPTIGIGSGPDCDGQILVTFDLVGLFPWFTPRFVKPRTNCAAAIQEAIGSWKASLTAPEVK